MRETAPKPKQTCPAKQGGPASPGLNEDDVRLKPVFGIRPGVYLTVLYSFVLFVALFFLLVFPGLVNGGALLSVITEPAGAAVRINDVYMGASADRIYLPAGSYTVEAVLPGFEKTGVVCQIPRRVFGSLFFPLRKEIKLALTASGPGAQAGAFAGASAQAFAQTATDFAAWSFAGEPTVSWQIPLSLSEGAYRAGPAADAAMLEILAASSRFAVTRAALRDLVRAKILLDNKGLSPSPTGLVGSISDILRFLSDNPGSAQWLAGLLPPEYAGAVKASAWHKAVLQREIPRNVRSAALPARMQAAGLSFININSFMISETPVSRSLFEAFLDQNPQWREHQTDYYPEQISVYPSDLSGREITGATWYAAEAFCEWLTLSLPPSMSGLEARLPTEAEWEVYANAIGVENKVWEWCADPFAPLAFIDASPAAIRAVGSPERSIRRFTITETRASLPPEMSSPFVTFRPVIAEKGN